MSAETDTATTDLFTIENIEMNTDNENRENCMSENRENKKEIENNDTKLSLTVKSNSKYINNIPPIDDIEEDLNSKVITNGNEVKSDIKIDTSKRLSLNTEDSSTAISNKNTPKNTPSNRSKNIGSKIPILNSYYIADESTTDLVDDIEKEVNKLNTPSNNKSSNKSSRMNYTNKNITSINNTLKLISPMSSTIRPLSSSKPPVSSNLKSSPANKLESKLKSPVPAFVPKNKLVKSLDVKPLAPKHELASISAAVKGVDRFLESHKKVSYERKSLMSVDDAHFNKSASDQVTKENKSARSSFSGALPSSKDENKKLTTEEMQLKKAKLELEAAAKARLELKLKASRPSTASFETPVKRSVTKAFSPKFSSTNRQKSAISTSDEIAMEKAKKEVEALEKKKLNSKSDVEKVKHTVQQKADFLPTVPQEFILSTSNRESIKPPTSEEIELEKVRLEIEQKEKRRLERLKETEKVKSSRTSSLHQFVPTIPVEFSFQVSARKSVLSQQELKESKSETSSFNGDEKKNHDKLSITVPISPKLSQRSRAKNGISTDEMILERATLEVEEREKRRAEMRAEIERVKIQRGIATKFAPTVPQEFHFNASRRSEVHNTFINGEYVPLTKAVENTFKSFRYVEPETASKPFVPTKPVGFHSHSEDRIASSKPKEQLTTEDKIALEIAQFQFKARPIAHNLFTQSEPIAAVQKFQPTVPKSPKLSTTERLGKITAVEEKIKEVKKVPSGPVQPFNLSTDHRGNQKEEALASRLKAIEEKKLREFHARPILESKVSLDSIAMTKAARMSMDIRAQSPTEEISREFHAKPVPQTHHNPFIPKFEETKIEFVPFSLHDESRAKRKVELDDLRKKREEEAEADKKRAEDEKKKKEEEEIAAYRASLIFKARNFVLKEVNDERSRQKSSLLEQKKLRLAQLEEEKKKHQAEAKLKEEAELKTYRDSLNFKAKAVVKKEAPIVKETVKSSQSKKIISN